MGLGFFQNQSDKFTPYTTAINDYNLANMSSQGNTASQVSSGLTPNMIESLRSYLQGDNTNNLMDFNNPLIQQSANAYANIRSGVLQPIMDRNLDRINQLMTAQGLGASSINLGAQRNYLQDQFTKYDQDILQGSLIGLDALGKQNSLGSADYANTLSGLNTMTGDNTQNQNAWYNFLASLTGSAADADAANQAGMTNLAGTGISGLSGIIEQWLKSQGSNLTATP
jgi:hypothetical protein